MEKPPFRMTLRQGNAVEQDQGDAETNQPNAADADGDDGMKPGEDSGTKGWQEQPPDMDEVGGEKHKAHRSNQSPTALRRRPDKCCKGKGEMRGRQCVDDGCPRTAPALEIPADLVAEIFLP